HSASLGEIASLLRRGGGLLIQPLRLRSMTLRRAGQSERGSVIAAVARRDAHRLAMPGRTHQAAVADGGGAFALEGGAFRRRGDTPVAYRGLHVLGPRRTDADVLAGVEAARLSAAMHR